MKTHQPKAKDIKREWHLIDAKQQVLGRLASRIAEILVGKHKINYVPHLDMGDWVVVINAEEVVLTGKKTKQKEYISHSGYPGGIKRVSYEKMNREMPEKVIEKAVYGMIPKNRLRSKRIIRLKVFRNDIHPYQNRFK